MQPSKISRTVLVEADDEDVRDMTYFDKEYLTLAACGARQKLLPFTTSLGPEEALMQL